MARLRYRHLEQARIEAKSLLEENKKLKARISNVITNDRYDNNVKNANELKDFIKWYVTLDNTLMRDQLINEHLDEENYYNELERDVKVFRIHPDKHEQLKKLVIRCADIHLESPRGNKIIAEWRDNHINIQIDKVRLNFYPKTIR